MEIQKEISSKIKLKRGLNKHEQDALPDEEMTRQEEILFYLNAKASIQFLKGNNPIIYNLFVLLSLCPSGLERRDCMRTLGISSNQEEMLNFVIKILVENKLVHEKEISSIDYRESESPKAKPTLKSKNLAKRCIYSVDPGLTCIIDQMEKDDIKVADEKIAQRMFLFLSDLNKESLTEKQRYSKLKHYEDNIWRTISRFADRMKRKLELKKQGTMASKISNNFSNSIPKQQFNTDHFLTSQNSFKIESKLERKGTYLSKKKEEMDK